MFLGGVPRYSKVSLFKGALKGFVHLASWLCSNLKRGLNI